MRDLAGSKLFGSLMGVLIVLVGAMVISWIVHSGSDPRDTVAAVIDREMTEAHRRSVRTTEDDGRLKVYVMSPGPGSAQPGLPPPMDPPPPAPGSPQTAGPIAQASAGVGRLHVVAVSAQLVESTTAGHRQKWSLTVKSSDTAPRRFTALIRFLDPQGNTTHTCRVRNLSVPAGATAAFQGSLVVDPRLPPSPARVEAEILPVAP